MTRRTKRLLMATVMCLAVLANVAVADGGLWVNGVNIPTQTSQTVPCGTGTAFYDGNGTLTLTNATVLNNSTSQKPALQTPEGMNLTIVLNGKNSIFDGDSDDVIYVGGNLTISGDSDSTLSVSGSTDEYNGINAKGAVTIKGPTPDEEGPTVTVMVNPTGGPHLYGVKANSLTVTDGSTLVSSMPKRAIYGGSAIFVNDGMTVEDGAKVTATSGSQIDNAPIDNGFYYGLNVTGDIIIKDATVTANAAASFGTPLGININGNIEISGNSEVVASGTAAAITGTGTLTITPPEGKVAEVKIGPNVYGTETKPFLNSPYGDSIKFDEKTWPQLIASENKYFSISVRDKGTETPPGGGTEGTPEGDTEGTPEGGTGVPLPEDDIPVIYPPKTGDNAPLPLYLGALLVSGTGIILITVYTRKRREER